jgi:ribosome biogenesis GTPase / thiamine phosphate phosphatase
VSSLERLGWNSFFEEQVRSADAPALWQAHLAFARVVEEQRGAYRVAGGYDGWSEVSGRFRHDAMTAADFPCVGDWVGVRDRIIHARLNRRSTLSRTAAGRAVEQQVVAANVDTVFVVTAFARDLNPRRLERYLTLVWEAGAMPVVVVNKADLCGDPDAAVDALRARVPFVDIVVTCAAPTVAPPMTAAIRRAYDPATDLAPYLRPASTVALLGSPGVGKSTIINRLLGRDAQKIADLDSDGKGRHTTTARQLVELESGALLIDTPGMRELQAWTDEAGIDAVFDEIVDLARECRFADCAHESEPGCAVLAAVHAGRLDADRLQNYRRLVREAAFETRKRDKAAAANTKRRWKQASQAAKALYRDRDRS